MKRSLYFDVALGSAPGMLKAKSYLIGDSCRRRTPLKRIIDANETLALSVPKQHEAKLNHRRAASLNLFDLVLVIGSVDIEINWRMRLVLGACNYHPFSH